MLMANNNISYKFMCVTTVHPAIGVFEVELIPTVFSVNIKVTINEVFDKMFLQIAEKSIKCG